MRGLDCGQSAPAGHCLRRREELTRGPHLADGSGQHLAAGAALAGCPAYPCLLYPTACPSPWQNLCQSLCQSFWRALCKIMSCAFHAGPNRKAAHKKSGAEAPLKKTCACRLYLLAVAVACACWQCLLPVHDKRHLRQNNFCREYTFPTRGTTAAARNISYEAVPARTGAPASAPLRRAPLSRSRRERVKAR